MVKAVIARQTGAPLEVVDLHLPAVAAGEVRVRVTAAGVCHSDLSMINGTMTPQFPVVLGHEGSGEVVEVGDDVTRVSEGDRVVLNWAPACRRCWYCLNGQPWLCATIEGVVSRPRGRLADGTEAHVCMGVGCYAEEVVLPAEAVVPLADEVPLDLAALLGCAVLTGIGAVRNTSSVRSGESVVVLGMGGIGLSAIIGARLAGAGPIIAVDINPDKEDLARAVGATHFVVSSDKVHREVRTLTEGRGADHALECIGLPTTIRAAYQCARRGGNVTVVGVGGRDQKVEFSALELFHFARTITGSVYGSGDPDRDVPILAEQVRLGRLDLASLVTHRIGLGEVDAAFERMRGGIGARSLIIM